MLELIYHEMLAIRNIFREISGINSSLSEEHVNSKADIATGEQKVQAVVTTIQRNENPFQPVPACVKLHNFPQAVMSGNDFSDRNRDQNL
jgi:hypothetical protein